MKTIFNLPESLDPPFPYSQAVKAGPLIFTSGCLATDYRSGIVAEAAVDPRNPYVGPPAVTRQTRYIFGSLGRLLRHAGSSLDNLVRVEQFITERADAPGFVNARREFLANEPPTSSLLVVSGLELPDARILVEGIAVESDGSWKKEGFSNADVPVNARGGYSLAQRTGPFVFLPGNTASDFKTGIHPEARVDHTFWFERDIVKQTEFILKTRRLVLEAMGLSLLDVVQATIYVTNITDLPDLEVVWHRHFPNDGPAVTVVPVAGLAVAGSVVEISVIALDGSKERRRRIDTDKAPPPPFRSPHAVQAGPYLFLSGLTASDADGLAREAAVDAKTPYYKSPVRLQAAFIFRTVAAICEAAGFAIDDLVKCHMLLTDLNDMVGAFDMWRDAFPSHPPASTVVGVPSPLIVPGCRVLQTWIAYSS